jgi:alanyl-tRNA synthetase
LQEPCCGTHLSNTADIHSFAIISLKSLATGLKSIRCLTGPAAVAARQRGVALCEAVLAYQDTVQRACQEDTINLAHLADIRGQLARWRTELAALPAVVALEMGAVLEELEQRLRLAERSVKKIAAEEQMKRAIGMNVL